MARTVAQKIIFDAGPLVDDFDEYVHSVSLLSAGDTLTRLVGYIGCFFRSEVQDPHLQVTRAAIYVRGSALSGIGDGTLTSNSDRVKWIGMMQSQGGGWFVQDISDWNPAGFWYSSDRHEIDVQGQWQASGSEDLHIHWDGFVGPSGFGTPYWPVVHLRAFYLLA